jgi:hypothetical protein
MNVLSDSVRSPRAPILAVLLLLLLLIGLATATLSAARPTALVELGEPDADLVVSGFHAPEQDGARRFRWSAGQSSVRLLNSGIGGARVLELWLGAGPARRAAPDLAVSANDRPVATLAVDGRPRRYRMLLPPAMASIGQLRIGLASETFVVAPDPRPLGVRVEAVAVDVLGAGVVWPAPAIVLGQGLVLACVAGVLMRCGWPAGQVVGASAFAAAGLALALHLPPAWFAPIYLARLAGTTAVLAALTAMVLPVLERQPAWAGSTGTARALWLAALLACAVRLVGTLYPPFDAYDLMLNLGRFERTVAGTLVDSNRSFEFRSGVTVYPAGPYLALMPGVLAGLTPKLAVQGGIAVVDGFGALATGVLALRLRQGQRAAVYAALVYAALPVMLTSLWFGHTAQVFGQGLMAPLALALLAGAASVRWRPWLIGGALLAMALLSHIGVTILAVAWLGLAWLGFAHALPRAVWWRFTAIFAVALAAGLLLVYGPAAQLKLAELGKVGERVAESGSAPAYNLIWSAWRISFYEPGWLLALVGLVMLRWAEVPAGGRVLVGSWLVAAVLFWTVEMVTALQVRYLVHLAPLACLALGVVLGRIAERGAAGRPMAWATTALLLALGGATWYIGVYENVQMSMVPLLR